MMLFEKVLLCINFRTKHQGKKSHSYETTKQNKWHCLFISFATLSFPMHMLYKVFPMKKKWVNPLLLFWSEFEFLLVIL